MSDESNVIADLQRVLFLSAEILAVLKSEVPGQGPSDENASAALVRSQ